MFADLVGSTVRSTSMDAEEYRDVVASYHACVADVVERFDGLVSQYLGDGVLVYFGYPKAHEDDAVRAVRAACAIIDALATLPAGGQRMETRIGIATGTVVVGQIFGRTAEPERGAVGETPNLAARLQSLAEPQSIVVDLRTRRLADAAFHFLDLGPHTIKGFPQPVQIAKVQGPADASTDGSAATHGPFVGRDLERAQLAAALDGARAGRGCVVAIKGDAGIGKSRLLREFLVDAARRGFLCRKGHVLDFGAAASHRALVTLSLTLLASSPADDERRIVQAIHKAIDEHLVEADSAPFLHDLIGVPLSDELRSRFDAMDKTKRDVGRSRALANLVLGIARAQPVVVAVEDVHWADQTTLSHLRHLCASIAECPVVVVLTSRSENDPFDANWRAMTAATPFVSLDLAPLTRKEAETLAEHLSGPLRDRVQECLARAAGNPLFLEQLLRNAAEGDRAGVPDTIQGIVQARLDRLEAPARQALQAASILGQHFEIDALRHVLGGSIDIDRLIGGLMVQRDSGGFRFSHALVHQAVYESVLRTRRRQMHRRAAQWFTDKDALLVAAHLDRADDRNEAARAYLTAARQQASIYLYEPAAKLVARGLELAADPAARALLSHLLGEVEQDLGHLQDSVRAFECAAEAEDPGVRCSALLGIAASKRVLDDLEGAQAALDRAEAVAGGQNLQRELARIAFLRGNLCFPRGDVEGCLREHSKSLRLAQEIEAPELMVAALGGLGDAEYLRGRMASAHRHFSRCVGLARQHSLAKTEIANKPMSAFTRLLTGDPEAAFAEAEEAIRLSETAGQMRAQMIAHHAAYLCEHGRLRLDSAAMHATRALELSQRLKAPRFEAESLAFRADVHRLAGRMAEARKEIDEAIVIGRRSGMTYFGPTLLSIAAVISSDPSARRAALAEAEALVDTSVSFNHFFLRRCAIHVFFSLREPDEVERHVGAFERFTEPEPTRWTEFHIERGKLLVAYLRNPEIGGSPAWTELRAKAKALWLDEAMIGLPMPS